MQSQTFIAPNDIQPSHAYSGSYDYSELTTRRPGISVSLKLCAVCHCLSTSTQKLHESIPDKSSTQNDRNHPLGGQLGDRFLVNNGFIFAPWRWVLNCT